MTRFWDKVDIRDKNSCWNWKACTDTEGYGRFHFEGRNCHAPRMALVFTDGEVPDDLCVLHKCDNRACVNPDHLYIGTNKDNTRDCETRGRAKHAKWDKHCRAKITLDQAREIKRRAAAGEKRCDLAKEFGLSSVAVSYIAIGKNWRGL